MTLRENSLGRKWARSAYTYEQELARRSGDDLPPFEEWLGRYVEIVEQACCNGCQEGWKIEGDYLCCRCRGLSEEPRLGRDAEARLEKPPPDIEAVRRSNHLARLFGNEDLPDDVGMLEESRAEVESYRDLPQGDPAHTQADEIIRALEGSASLRQAVLPRILRSRKSRLAQWTFEWGCLAGELSRLEASRYWDEHAWEVGGPERSRLRWALLKEFLSQAAPESDQLDANKADEVEPNGSTAKPAQSGPDKKAQR